MSYLVAVVVVWFAACLAAGVWFRALDRQECKRARDLEAIVALDWRTPDLEGIR